MSVAKTLPASGIPRAPPPPPVFHKRRHSHLPADVNDAEPICVGVGEYLSRLADNIHLRMKTVGLETTGRILKEGVGILFLACILAMHGVHRPIRIHECLSSPAAQGGMTAFQVVGKRLLA